MTAGQVERRDTVVVPFSAIAARELVDGGHPRGLTSAAAFVLCRALDQAAEAPGRVDEQRRRMHVHLDGDQVAGLAQADTAQVAIYLRALDDIDRELDDQPIG